MTKEHVDEFLSAYAGTCRDYNEFWDVCKLISTLSHGQSFTERRFNDIQIVKHSTFFLSSREVGYTATKRAIPIKQAEKKTPPSPPTTTKRIINKAISDTNMLEDALYMMFSKEVKKRFHSS